MATGSLQIIEAQIRRSASFNAFPDLTPWVVIIRNQLNGPIYVILHKYFDVTYGSESDINLPDQSNEQQFREKYFNVSNYDSNIWIVNDEFIDQTNILKNLFKNPKKFNTMNF